MSTHWYLFCPASGLGFLLMEFPWLFFSHPTKMLPFGKFSLPFSHFTLSSLAPSFARSPSRTFLLSLSLSLALSPSTFPWSRPASRRHRSTVRHSSFPRCRGLVWRDLVELSACPSHTSNFTRKTCIYSVCTDCFGIQFESNSNSLLSETEAEPWIAIQSKLPDENGFVKSERGLQMGE